MADFTGRFCQSGGWLLANGEASRNIVLLAVCVMAVIFLVVAIVFGRLFSIWMRAFLAGAPVSVMALLGMMLRRTPMKKIVAWKIAAVQGGVPITTAQLESAYLQGADVELAVLAMIRARKINFDLTWEEAISTDAADRLREKLLHD